MCREESSAEPFNLSPQGCFCRADWDSKRDVISVAVEKGMIAGANDSVQITGSSAMGSGIAFARNANALAVTSTGFDANF